MNQDTSTALRGAIVGIATVVGTLYPQYAAQALQIGGAAYAILALLKPWLPAKLQASL